MSTPSSTPEATEGSGSLAARAEERFFTLDHVGVVRHFEGTELSDIIEPFKRIVGKHGAKLEEATEQLRGRPVYTNISTLRAKETLTVWLTATQVEGVGTVLDAKIYHPTEASAEADEQLALLVEELQRQVLRTG